MIQEVIAKLGELCSKVVAVPIFKDALVKMIQEVAQEEEVLQAVAQLFAAVFAQPVVANQTYEVLQKASNEVLEDEEVQRQSRTFVATVMGDDLLQREGGTALWKSVLYALQPGMIR